MGIRLLNKLLKNVNTNGIYKKNLSELRGKVIVIDISIYMYRFLATNSLIENCYLMCSVFLEYDITPLFIFDGSNIKNEKKDTIKKRAYERNLAKIEYEHLLSESNAGVEINSTDLYKLKKKSIKLTHNDVDKVKTIIELFGMRYITAHGEADELCAAFVISNKAYACLTEDTDLFIYNCPRVLKYISLINHTVIYYNLNDILLDLQMGYNDLLNICLLSGTDYNKQITGNIYKNRQLFLEYKADNSTYTFLEWMCNKKYLNQVDINKINSISKIYQIDFDSIFMNLPYIVLKNRKLNRNELENYMSPNGFIFN